MDNIKA